MLSLEREIWSLEKVWSDKVRAVIAEIWSRTVGDRKGLAERFGDQVKINSIHDPPNRMLEELKELLSRPGRLEGDEVNEQFNETTKRAQNNTAISKVGQK